MFIGWLCSGTILNWERQVMNACYTFIHSVMIDTAWLKMNLTMCTHLNHKLTHFFLSFYPLHLFWNHITLCSSLVNKQYSCSILIDIMVCWSQSLCLCTARFGLSRPRSSVVDRKSYWADISAWITQNGSWLGCVLSPWPHSRLSVLHFDDEHKHSTWLQR